MPNIRVKLNVTRLLKEHFFKGKNGTYVDIVLWKNDEPDQYGNDYSVQQDLPKTVRDSGVKAPYVGSGKTMESRQAPAPSTRKSPPPGGHQPHEEGDIPF